MEFLKRPSMQSARRKTEASVSRQTGPFSKILDTPKRRWQFNQSPLFLRFLQGKEDYECTPWGNPTYNIFGWQKPCYLLGEGYAKSFAELMEETEWEKY